MASVKKNTAITAEDCAKIMKEHFDPQVTITWHDKAITVKKCITIDEFVEFMKEVVDNSFTQDTNTFRPEARDFAVRASTIKHYTDVQLPEDPREMFMFLYLTDIYDVVYNEISKDQFHALIIAINKKIDTLVESAVSANAVGVTKIVNQIEMLASNFGSFLGDITPDDVTAFVKAVSSGGNLEERILEAYQKTKKES